MIFTILTFRALGRTHIASKPCVAIAMLCFDSTVGFPWSVPVLKQQLIAGAQRPFAREGAAWPAAIFVRPEQHPCPREGEEARPARDRGLRAAPQGKHKRSTIGTGVNPSFKTTLASSPCFTKKPSAPAFGSRPSLASTRRWALSQALPRQYSIRLTPGAGLSPSAPTPRGMA